MTKRVHLITGGYPRGTLAGHDMDYARLNLLQFLAEWPDVVTTVAADFTDTESWLADAQLLITYVAGPYPNEEQNSSLQAWLDQGGRWFALHGSSGGKAVRVKGGRAMVKTSHHQTLGGIRLFEGSMYKSTATIRSHGICRTASRWKMSCICWRCRVSIRCC
jgi:hypothetical protein